MRKIFKKIHLAKTYEKWESDFENNNHEKYNSSNKFYEDILAELLILQGGVCAYSEMLLIDNECIDLFKQNFTNGKFNVNVLKSKRIPVDLEHFDSRLKSNFGWKWDNFFAVFRPINQNDKRIEEEKLIKIGKGVDSILKPDLELYNPINLFDYDEDLNLFLPNSKLSIEDFERVKTMILCLGINNAFVKMHRENYYNELKLRILFGEKPELIQFFTGWEIMKKKHNEN